MARGSSSGAGASPVAQSEEDRDLMERGRQLVTAIKYTLEAYILFDVDGSGSIDRDEVMAMIANQSVKVAFSAHAHKHEKRRGAAGGGSGANALLSKERWEELDWDR